MLLQFLVFLECYTQKPLTLYQLETVAVPIEDSNTEANSYTCLQLIKDYLAMTEKNYIFLASAEFKTFKHIGHEHFYATIFLIKHRTSQSCKSAVFVIFLQILLMTIVNFSFT